MTTLSEYRRMAGVTQAEMATYMCMPRRTLEDIEAGKAQFRPVHDSAAKMALLRIAQAKGDASFLPQGLLGVVLAVAEAHQRPWETDADLPDARNTKPAS